MLSAVRRAAAPVNREQLPVTLPGGDVDGHPTHIAVAQLDLADVQPGANLNFHAVQLVSKGDRAVDPSPGAVEGARIPSPVVLMSWPPCCSTSRWANSS